MAAPAVIISLSPTVYAYTTTTTITATVTGTLGQAIYLPFPAPTTTVPLEYTTLPSPTDLASKLYPTPLPILTITQVDNVIVNPSGHVIETATMVQAAPPVGPTLPSGQDPGEKVYLKPPRRGWEGWALAAKIGFFVGIGLALLSAVLVMYFMLRWRQKKRQGEIEDGYLHVKDPADNELAPRSKPPGQTRNFSRPLQPSPLPGQASNPSSMPLPPSPLPDEPKITSLALSKTPTTPQHGNQTVPRQPANLRGWDSTRRRIETRFPVRTPPSSPTTFVQDTAGQESVRNAAASNEAYMMHGGLGHDGASVQSGVGSRARGKSPFADGKVGRE